MFPHLIDLAAATLDACALARTSIGSYEYAGDARTAGAHTARVKLSGASGNCVLKGAGREASVYP